MPFGDFTARVGAVGIVGLLIWGAASGLFFWGTFLALLSTRRPRRGVFVLLEPITILKPLKGVDPGLEENLRSFFELDYPRFELLFSVEDARDPAVAVVRRLIARYPRIEARLLSVAGEAGVNPKVNNMMRAYEEAAFDVILISDSNVRARPDYLRGQMEALQAGVGLVSAVVCGTGAKGLGGGLESTFLNTFYARWMWIAARAGHTCVVGKSMLFRKSEARRFGGLANLARYLAEDYMAGEAMRKLGRRVVLARDPVYQVVGACGLRAFWQRHLRWGRIRKAQSPPAFLGELFLGSFVSGLCGAAALQQIAGVPIFRFLSAHLILWFLCDLLVMIRLRSGLSLANVTRQAFFWVVREALALPLWIHTASGSSVNWRGNRLRIEAGGLLTTK